jgi:hypothetical protein
MLEVRCSMFDPPDFLLVRFVYRLLVISVPRLFAPGTIFPPALDLGSGLR